jgi:hypothetical protein
MDPVAILIPAAGFGTRTRGTPMVRVLEASVS